MIPKAPLLTLELLTDLNSKVHQLYPSHQWIADKLNYCRLTIIRAMQWLRKNGYIDWVGRVHKLIVTEDGQEVDKSWAQTTNLYTITSRTIGEDASMIKEDSSKIKNTPISKKQNVTPKVITTNPVKNINCKLNTSYSYMFRSINPDREMAAEFIEAWFPRKKMTFQTIPETPQAIKLAKEDLSKGARIIHGTLDQCFDTLVKYNRAGHGIHVSINNTDYKGRKNENTVSVNGYALDLDGAPLEKVMDYTLKFNCEPIAIICSSPGKYHVYWKTDNCPKTLWPAIQKSLAKKFDGDGQVHKLNQTLRLPGFFHLKSEPVMSKIIHIGDCILPYRRARRLFPVPKPKPLRKTDFEPTGEMWENVTYGAYNGERNDMMFKFVCKMRTFDVDLNTAESEACHYAECCDPPLPEKIAKEMVRNVWNRYSRGWNRKLLIN